MNPPLESGLADPDVRVTTVFPSQRGRGVLLMLGPAFVAAVAYVDPGNFATNISAGAAYGYRMLWVVVLANQ